MDLASRLNPEQLAAATTVDGPLLILAGAGSGKTRVLVHRIAHILQSGRARPHEIFAVTFTNKAAGEMRSRLVELLGEDVREAWIGTFHALSARMLRIEGHRLGYARGFSIYDEDDARRLIKALMDAAGIEASTRGLTASQVASEIDRAKNLGRTPAAFLEAPYNANDLAACVARKIYPRYQEALRRANAMDFGDLLLLAVEVLRHHPEARARFHRRFRYVMVDEFQDTNAVQYELLRLLVHPTNNLAVVGDDDQAIYRWRGADVSNILGFEKEFPGATMVKLEQNYRSTGNILAAANTVIRRNRRRHQKTLRTAAEPGAKVAVGMFDTSEDEAERVAQLIRHRLDAGERPESFAILYRQNAQSRLFEAELRRYGVPFVLIGGTGFYERLEVKDVLAYLRLTANPASRQDFERVVATPPRGIGEKTLAALRTAAEGTGAEGALLLELPERAFLDTGLKPAAIEKLKALGALLADLRALAETASASTVARAVIEKTDYVGHLRRIDPHGAEDRAANVMELVSSITDHEGQLEARGPAEDGLGLAGARTPLEAFLDTAALTSTTDETSREGAVSMLTLHAAKGLEFPYVFVVGMEELTFPAKRAVEGDAEAMEEERRLCYVGMTRARQELTLVAARQRRIYGKVEVRWPSRFLAELPDTVVDNIDIHGRRQGGAARVASDARVDRAPGQGTYEALERRIGRSSVVARRAPTVERENDRIVYDGEGLPPEREDNPAHSPVQPSSPGRRRTIEPAAEDPGLRPGARVFHNTFGEGTVVEADGRGPAARLTIRFPAEGLKRVVARFVRSLEES